MKRKGVCYDVGRVMMGGNWRPRFDSTQVRKELAIIRGDLHCNAVRVCGLDLDRLATAAEAALAEGLEVWLSPEMWDRDQDETLEYLKEAASRAEGLRTRWPGRLVFSLGSELTLFMNGMVEGANFYERMNRPSFWEDIRAGRHNVALNGFLRRVATEARQVFNGPLTYFSVPLESVDWSPLDFVGVDLYRDARMREAYGGIAHRYLAYGKPVVIGEFGCCTYKGADLLGGNGFMVAFGMMEGVLGEKLVLPESISRMVNVPPRVDGHYVRDEALQARELSDQLGVLDAAGMDGAFVFTFVSPNSPYNEDPRYDSDLSSFSLVKSYPEEETAAEFARQATRQGKLILGVDVDPELIAAFNRDVGRRGTTYPDMPWEPKESFAAVARYYASH